MYYINHCEAHQNEHFKYIGVNDRDIDLFEGQYVAPNGMAYNFYVIADNKTAVMDTVDTRIVDEWLGNLSALNEDSAPQLTALAEELAE